MWGIDEEVEKKLRKDQERKDFKDAGRRVGGSKKEKAAYKSLIRLSDLINLEEDEVTAAEMVVKDKVYPKIDPEAEREKGISSGAAFLKHELRAAFPQKPKLNSKEARKAYVSFVEILLIDLDRCVNVFDVGKVFLSYYQWQGSDIGFLIDPRVREKHSSIEILNQVFSPYKVRQVMVDFFGAGFCNLMYQASKTTKEKWKKAYFYEGITAEQERDNLDKWNKKYQRELDHYIPKIKFLKEATKSQLNEERRRWQHVSKELDVFRITAIQYCEGKVKTAEKYLNNLPEDQKQQPPSWAWTGKKERKEPVKKTDIQINSGVSLAFIKRTGGLHIETVTEEEIIKKFGFTGVEFGNYVRDNEAKQHVRHFLGASADLFEVLNFNAIQINQMNQLAIAFGSRGTGRALATYNWARKIINITKSRGDGTVAHEWAHYLDNLLYRKLLVTSGYQKPLATGSLDNLEAGEIKSALTTLMKYIHKGDETHQKVKVYFPPQNKVSWSYLKKETLEKSLENIKLNYAHLFVESKKYLKDQINVFGFLARVFNLEYIEVDLILNAKSLYYYYSSKLKSYWTEPWELFARAFETYIYDKLAKAGRVNNYLVSGGYFEHSAKVYPFGEEREKLYALYDNLMIAIKNELHIKDFVPFTTIRTDEYISFDQKSKQEKVTGGVVVASKVSKLLLLEIQFLNLN